MPPKLPESEGLCYECGIDYPPGCVAPFGAEKEPLCGICALRAINAQHHTNFKRFHGPGAEAKRQAAIAFRQALQADAVANAKP